LLLTVHGCTTLTSSYRTTPVAIEVPATWSVANDTASVGSSSLAQWWLRFNDPLLGNLVAQAMQANTSVKSAEAALRQARALRDVATAALLPKVGTTATAQRSKSGDSDAINRFNAGLDASWEIDVFGAKRSALNASTATARASAASLGDVQVSIAAEVALSYITLRAAQARMAIARNNLASQQETQQITQWRMQAGLVTTLDVEQARAATEQTNAQLPLLQTGIDQASHALAVLTGQPPAALLTVLSSVGPVPQADDNLAMSMPADTLRQRPDVRAAEFQVTAALARVSQAEAARLPSFNLGGSLGLSALTLGALTNGASVVSSLLASITMPVFDGGAIRGQIRAQQAALDQAGMAYKAVVLKALQEVENALVAIRGDRERLLHLREAAMAATSAAQLARQSYDSGLVDFATVLQTQRTQLSTQDSVASANSDLSADHVRLYKALGGGWIPDSNNQATSHTEQRTPLS
jgi:NodT family efflux transporter outer membrane factor (OMF) lipoprotein